MPSGCIVRLPVTFADFPSGVCRDVAPLATQPAPAGSMENSSRPTDLPSSRILNFPLSAVKSEPVGFLSMANAHTVRETVRAICAARREVRLKFVIGIGFLSGLRFLQFQVRI